MSKISLSFYRICEIKFYSCLNDEYYSIKIGDYSYKKCAFNRLKKLKLRTNGLYEILFFPYPFCDEDLIQVIYSDYYFSLEA